MKATINNIWAYLLVSILFFGVFLCAIWVHKKALGIYTLEEEVKDLKHRVTILEIAK